MPNPHTPPADATRLREIIVWARQFASEASLPGGRASELELARKLLVLADAAEASEASLWRPIESAPRDGTAIWLLVDGVPCIGYCDPANWLHKVDRWMIKSGVRRRSVDDQQRSIPDDIYGTYGFAEPTLWQPLPTPPTEPT